MVCKKSTTCSLIYSRGAFKPPAPLQLEAFRPKALRFAWGSAQSDEYNEVAHSLTSVRSRYLGFINFFTGIYLVTGQRSVYFETG